MVKKRKYIIIAAVLGLVSTVGVVLFVNSKPESVSSSYWSNDDTGEIPSIDEKNDSDTYSDIEDKNTYTPAEPPQAPADMVAPTNEPDEPFVPATEIDLDPKSITVFVNSEHTLPRNYVPENLVTVNVYFHLKSYDDRTLMRADAAKALEELFAAAREAGYELSGVSGYRSYSRQRQIFINNILTKGKEHTLKYSAVPGASEHQTGLAMDVSCKSLGYDLDTGFSETPEGKWLAQNAHLYGYIIRYPKGKAHITGYAYEPWHVRYVGKGLAKYLYENDLTLEEYYNYTPSKDFNFEKKYAALINITPSPAPSIEPEEIDGIIVDENGEIIDQETDIDPIPTEDPLATDSPDSAPDADLTPDPDEDVISSPSVTDIPDEADITDMPQVPSITEAPQEPAITDMPQIPEVSDFPEDISETDYTHDLNGDPAYTPDYESN